DVRDSDWLIVAKSALAPERAISLAQRRHFRHAGDLLAVTFQPDQRGPNRNSPDVAAGAVDRINDPAKSRRTPGIPRLFAEKAIVGKPLQETLAQKFFGFAVGDGNRSIVLFPLDHLIA